MSSTKLNSNGQPVTESYQSKSISQIDKNGQKIGEKQQAYKNSSGVEKAGYERHINDKAHKIVKARDLEKNEDYEHNFYKGISEDNITSFNQDFNNAKSSIRANRNQAISSGSNGNRQLKNTTQELPDKNYRMTNKKK